MKKKYDKRTLKAVVRMLGGLSKECLEEVVALERDVQKETSYPKHYHKDRELYRQKSDTYRRAALSVKAMMDSGKRKGETR